MTFSGMAKGRHTITVRAACPNDGDTGMLKLKFKARR